MAWPKESRRHGLARKGIPTVIDGGRRFDVSNFVARGQNNEFIKVAKLTDEEETAWNFAFEFYLNEGKSNEEADELAWRDLQTEFPRLKGFDGIASGKRGN